MQDNTKNSAEDDNLPLADADKPDNVPELHDPGSVISPKGQEAEEPSLPEDEKTESAVDDIVEKEGDTVLAAEDSEVAKAFEPKKTGKLDKIKELIRKWWDNPIARWSTIAGAAMFFILLLVIPMTRYFLLNTFGVRSSASVTVLDESTKLPLKNVEVAVANRTGKTDGDGVAKLTKVKLGHTNMVVKKRAFAELKKPLTVGWGSNPLGSLSLKAVGAQYTFLLKDFLSDKAIEKGAANSGDADAQSDKNGKILLTVDASDETQLTVTITAKDYRDEKLTFGTDNKANQVVKMVPSLKHAFISKRSGKYDLYKVDLDGKNEKVSLKGTGSESDDITLLPNPSEDLVALVSTRDNSRNADGYLLSSLNLVDLADDSVVNVAKSERIRLIGWSGSRLVYIQVAAGASAGNSQRERLMSYNYKNSDKKQLASSNSFSDAKLIGDTVYYTPTSYNASPGTTGLFQQTVEGTNKQTIIDEEIWSLYRTDYDKLVASSQNGWYEYKVGDSKANKLGGAPASLHNRVYSDSPNKKHSAWVDNRDGKGVLLIYDISSKTDKVLRTQSGLTVPMRWFSNTTLVYRIHTDQETADYAISTDGGDARKVKDVTSTTPVDQIYYY